MAAILSLGRWVKQIPQGLYIYNFPALTCKKEFATLLVSLLAAVTEKTDETLDWDAYH